MNNYLSGESFIDSIYNDLINSDEVKKAISRRGMGARNREDAIKAYVDRLNKAHSSDRKLTLIKSLYYKRYVIDHLPESYIQMQWKIAREQGYGDVRLTDNMKKDKLKQIRDEQKKSLDSWLTYLNSKDAMYPMWFKYYAFQGMLKLGKYNKEQGKFTKRSKDTVLPFIEVNPEILGYMYSTLTDMIDKKLSEEEKKALNNGESFSRLYTYILKNKINDREKTNTVEGIWVKYEQDSNYKKLCESLQGKNTGWCTAGEETCKIQIKNGDFYVYYTKDEKGEYTEPRIAIRMEGTNNIGEVRGIDNNQNLESEMIYIAEKKLDEFPDKYKYLKKTHDMKLLTEIENKTNKNEDLTKEEIRLLYEIGSEIEGFGLEKDPRIEEIKARRNVKKDLAKLFDCKEENIGTTLADFDKNEIVAYIGDISLQEEIIPSKFKSLKVILGDADFSNLKTAEGLENLQTIGKNAYFDNLPSSQGLESLQNINGDAGFYSLKTAEGLESLQSIGGTANFDILTNSHGLENLQSIGGEAGFYKLTSTEGLKSLQSIGKSAYFNNITEAKGLENLQRIGLNAYFYDLISAKGLESLQSIDGYADFRNLTSSHGLENLKNIGREADFRSLTSSRGLENLKNIGWNADFRSLTSSQGLENLQSIGGTANFRSLTSSYGLESLQSIGRDANFNNLTSSQGLKNLQSIGGVADFKSLTSSQGLGKLQKIGKDAVFRNIKSAKGLESLQSIGRDAYFNELTSSQGLENLQSIGSSAYFNSLTNAQSLKKLQSIGRYAYFDSLADKKSIKHIKVGCKIFLPSKRSYRRK